MSDVRNENDRRALDEFSNAGAQRNQPARRPPEGHALVRPTQALADRIVGAQAVAVHRDDAQIWQTLTALAARAGADWFYRYSVNSKDGKGWIEGASIKLANNVARVYGNNETQIREVDVGDAWVFYARFTDYETGFSMERAYHQRKSQVSMRTKDTERQQDIAYQIGQSKAIRNVILNALDTYCKFAFEEAQNSIVEKIGRDLEAWRKRTVDGLARIPVDLARVERQIGKPAKSWLAPDIAHVIAQGKQIADGMADVDEVFPPLPPGEKAEPAAAAQSTEPPSAPAGEQGNQAQQSEPSKPSGAAPKNAAEYLELVRVTCDASGDADQLEAWFKSAAQRNIRNAAGMVSEETLEARKLIDARIKALRGAS